MINKKYKKGFSDASNAYQAFGEKQSEALEHILGEIRNGNCTLEEAIKKFGDINGNVENLYKYLKSKEKAQLYSIYTPLDIANLDKEEKLFLVGILFRLTIDKLPTEAQQKFIRSVQRYLDIKEPPFGVDISAIEEIESMNAQKAIYQVVLEYLILQDGDSFDETEIQHSLLESFNLNNKNRQTIEEHVKLLYRATGAEGLVEKYGFVTEAETETASEEEPNNSEKNCEEESTPNFVEPYVGIPLKLAETIRPKEVDCDRTCFKSYKSYFETKDFFIFQDTNTPKSCWSCYDKQQNNQRMLNALESENTTTTNPIGIKQRKSMLFEFDFWKFHLSMLFSQSQNCKGDSGKNFVIDYQRNLLYFLFENHLYCIDIEKDTQIKYDVDIQEGFLDLHKNIILISSNERIQYFNTISQTIETVTDACGQNISAAHTAVILNDYIYFYSNHGKELSANDGGN